MLRKIRVHSRRLLIRRKFRNRFYLKKNNIRQLARLVVNKSGNNIYAQVIDDVKGITLASSSSLLKDIRPKGTPCNVNIAKAIGADLATKALAAGVKEIIFDKGGHAYHGKVKSLADAARENGLKF